MSWLPFLRKKKAKFVIIAQARSGSTLLRKSLHEHSDVICHGEVLSRKWINGLVPLNDPAMDRSSKPVVAELMESRENNIENFLDQYIYSFESGAVGFKIIYEDMFLSGNLNQIKEYFEKNNVMVFHLVRLNPLATFYSRRRMALHGVSHSDAPTDEVRSSASNICIYPNEVQAYIAQQTVYRNKVDILFKDAETIFYERISDGYRVILEKMRLDIKPMKKTLRKLNTEALEDVILNYIDVKKYDLSVDGK